MPIPNKSGNIEFEPYFLVTNWPKCVILSILAIITFNLPLIITPQNIAQRVIGVLITNSSMNLASRQYFFVKMTTNGHKL